jgi:hypothetical protein
MVFHPTHQFDGFANLIMVGWQGIAFQIDLLAQNTIINGAVNPPNA